MTQPPKPQTPHHRYVADDDEHESYAPIGIEGLLAATEKVLAVNRGVAEPDDKDSPTNDRVYTQDRLMAERVKLDQGKTLRMLMGRFNRSRSLSSFTPDSFSSYTLDALKGNPLIPAPEEVNPMHLVEQRRRITKMGPGGIGDPNAITLGMNSVHAGQFGFIDPVAGPESSFAGVDTRLAYGTRVGSDGRIYQVMRNRRTGKLEWVSPVSLKGKTIKLPD